MSESFHMNFELFTARASGACQIKFWHFITHLFMQRLVFFIYELHSTTPKRQCKIQLMCTVHIWHRNVMDTIVLCFCIHWDIVFISILICWYYSKVMTPFIDKPFTVPDVNKRTISNTQRLKAEWVRNWMRKTKSVHRNAAIDTSKACESSF